MGQCEGRVALVTGASRGIGRATARRLAAEGASVIVSASRPGSHGPLAGTLEEAAQQIRSEGGRVAVEVANLVDESERGDLVARAEAHFGPLDILVNNAAMARWAPPSTSPLSDRHKMLEVNFNAPVDLCQQVLPGMRARRRGWIVNVTSDSARHATVPFPDSAEAAHAIVAYGASKAALDRYTNGLGLEVAPDGVYVNALAPVAIVLTQETRRFVGDIARRRPDMAEPMEVVVEAVLELATRPHAGRVTTSRALLHEIARPVRSLDGARVLGDALMPVDLDAEIV